MIIDVDDVLGQVGTCAKGLRVINSDNGMQLGADLIAQFHAAYKDDPVMGGVGAFLCSLPVAMCQAFVPFNRSIIVIATIRYEQGRSEQVAQIALTWLYGII